MAYPEDLLSYLPTLWLSSLSSQPPLLSYPDALVSAKVNIFALLQTFFRRSIYSVSSLWTSWRKHVAGLTMPIAEEDLNLDLAPTESPTKAATTTTTRSNDSKLVTPSTPTATSTHAQQHSENTVPSGGSPDKDAPAAAATGGATSDRAEFIERLKRGESPTWIPNRYVRFVLFTDPFFDSCFANLSRVTNSSSQFSSNMACRCPPPAAPVQVLTLLPLPLLQLLPRHRLSIS